MTESRIKSADDLIVAVEREQLGKLPTQPAQPVKAEKQEDSPKPQDDAVEKQADADDKEPEKDKESAPEPESHKADEETKAASDDKSPADGEAVDEYGNTIAKDRVYTQDEVNRMIRERLARAKQPDAVAPAPAQATQPEPTADGEESWETQLDTKIDQRVEQRELEKQQRAWEAKQQSEMAQYAEKFEAGSAKYTDFESVVTGKPITASMMMATKSMQDPAAFIYAVCKAQPAELERIAKIPDQHVQIAEMARLEERMKRPKATTNTPKPSRKISGDASSEMPKYSVDQLIASHAREKIVNTRRLK